MEPEMIPIWEASHRAERCVATIYSACTRGILRFTRSGRKTLIVADSLINFEKVHPGRPMGSVKPKTPPERRLLNRLEGIGRGGGALALELKRILAAKNSASE